MFEHLYGALGNAAFRYFEPAIAEAITSTGQYIIRYVEKNINGFLNEKFKTDKVDYVIGMDTDSVMIRLDKFVEKIDPNGKIKTEKMVDIVNQFCEKDIEVFLAEIFAKLAERLNARTNTLDMKREAICDYGLFRAKKNYIMRVWDMEHVRYAEPQLKIAGIETQRSDKPRMCRDAMLDIIPEFFDGKESVVQEKVKEFKKVFMNSDLKNISTPKGVNEIDKYMRGDEIDPSAKGIPINSRAAIAYNMMLDKFPDLSGKYEKIREGDKIRYMYLKQPNSANSHVIAFKTELPKEFGIEKNIDKELQFEKTFLDPIQSLATLVNWNAVKVYTLDDMFE